MENVRKLVPEEEKHRIDLYTYWKVFWRKKYYLLIPLILSLVIAVIGVRYLTPIYQSVTLLSLEDQNILSRSMGRYITPVEERARMRNRQYRAMIDTRLKSRDFLELVVKDLGLHQSLDVQQTIQRGGGPDPGIPAEELIMRHLVGLLKDKIHVENPMPGFFSINVFDSDPNTAFVLASRVSEKYIAVIQQAQLQGLRQAGAFSIEQLAIYREKLEASEKQLAQINREMNETDVESNPVNGLNVHTAEARQRSLKARIDNSELSLRRVRQRLMSIFGLVPSSEKVSSNERAASIERRIRAYGEEQLLAELGTEAAVETMVEQETSGPLWEELRGHLAEIVNGEYDQFSADLRPLITEYFYQRYIIDYFRFRERKLNTYIGQYRKNMQRRPVLEQEHARLVNEVETNRAIYQAFLESKTSAQITEAALSTNLGMRITVIEKAEKPLVPVKPNKMKIIILALIFGMACGIGAILITEYMDDSFRTIEEVQRFMKLPVLGTIPKTVTHFAWEKQKRGRMILFWIIGLFIFVTIVSGALYMYARNLRGTRIKIELSEDQS